MPSSDNPAVTPTLSDGGAQPLLSEQLEELAKQFGNRFLLEPAPDNQLPEHGMPAVDAMRLIGEELVLDGIPMRNLATFVTTWMEPEAQRIIAENLHRNFIDHAEYPQTAEIEQRCIRMLADLFHAPGETTGARTQGSSEAIMLGALSLKWKWRQRREEAGQGHGRARTSSSAATCTSCGRSSAATSTSSRASSRCSGTSTRSAPRTWSRTSTRTRSASPRCWAPRSPATPTTSSGSTISWSRLKDEKGLDVPLHVDGASGGFVWPFLYPDSEWDFRLEQVRSINASGHKFGLVYPGIGWLVFRETQRPGGGPRLLRELPRQDRRDVHAELLDRLGDGAGPVLQLRPLRAARLQLHHGDDAGEHPRCSLSRSPRSGRSS